MPEKRIRTPKTTHKIAYVKFKKDKLQCICLWLGRAYDRPKNSPDFDPELDWPTHKKTAPPIDIHIEDQYKGNYPLTIKKERAIKKEKVAA